MLETLDYTIYIGSTPTFLYFKFFSCIPIYIYLYYITLILPMLSCEYVYMRILYLYVIQLTQSLRPGAFQYLK